MNTNQRSETELEEPTEEMVSKIPIDILFVDDNPSFLEITERYFETSNHDFTVETCQNSEEALEKMDEGDIDCVVSDYQMPEMNGLELLEQVKRKHPEIPFLLLTSKGSEEVASEAISKGITDYINKGGMEKYELVAQRAKNAVIRTRKDEELNKRLRQQKVTAELGQKALGEDADLDQLMHDAAKKVAEILGNDYCKVLDLQHDKDRLLLRQGVGWKEGIVGEASVKAAKEENSQASYTLSSEEPVIVTDMEEEDRFEGPELLTSHNVKSGISTIIGHPDDPWGILGTHDTEKKDFDWYDVEFVQNVANILANAIDRKNREGRKEQKKQKRFYEAILSSTPDLIYVFDLDYRFIYANDALLEMWGRSREEALGKTLREIGYEPWHVERHERELDQVVETKEPVRGEISFPHADLGERIYDYIFVPVLDNEGEVETIAGTTRDITELKETEEELQSTVERLEDFNSIIGHDLKSPLNTAQSYLDLALKLDGGEDDIEEAQKLLKRMETMIDDLEMLTLSPETLERKEVHLKNAFTEAYTLAGVEASYEVENTTLEAGKGFTRLLSNLIRNSVEHNEGTVKIRAEPLENEEGFYYEDNGKGIPEDKREKVLERGFTTSDTGSGLGLYIVKRIAQLHDWNIEITESEEGGARLEFYT